MEYVIADLKKAKNWGFTELGHAVRGSLICLNEKEVMGSTSLKGTLKERAEELAGYVTSVAEAKLVMNG